MSLVQAVLANYDFYYDAIFLVNLFFFFNSRFCCPTGNRVSSFLVKMLIHYLLILLGIVGI